MARPQPPGAGCAPFGWFQDQAQQARHSAGHTADLPAQRSLAETAAAAVAGTADAQELLTALLGATVFCEAPQTPGVMTVETPEGPVVPAYTSLSELAAARGAVAWFSTSGLDLLGLVPAGHDLLLDPAGPNPLVLRPAALQAAVHVS